MRTMPIMIIDGVPYGVIQSAMNKRRPRTKIEEAQIVEDCASDNNANMLHITD